MSPKASPRSLVFAQTDPIRIVPLHLPKELTDPTPEVQASATPPQLIYNGGPLLSAVEVFTIFWGSTWNTAPQQDLMTTLNHFFDFVLTSELLDQLGEYSVPQYPIKHGKRTGTVVITTPAPRHVITDTAIRHMLQQEISTNRALPPPSANTLYFVYLPPGVVVVQGGSRSCSAFCGYHDALNGQIFYAAMPYPNCTGCLGSLSVQDALTSTSSHELCEVITDAIPGQGWYDEANGEIGDICAWKTKTLGNYLVQLEWSNTGKTCT